MSCVLVQKVDHDTREQLLLLEWDQLTIALDPCYSALEVDRAVVVIVCDLVIEDCNIVRHMIECSHSTLKSVSLRVGEITMFPGNLYLCSS